MDIAGPEQRVYFYECSRKKYRLLYCIPPQVLKRAVTQQKVRSDILKDYPDGVDMEVSAKGFDEFRIRYGLKPPADCADLRDAFIALVRRFRRSYWGTGYIDAEYLELLARKVRDEIEKGHFLPELERKVRPKTLKESKRQIQGALKLNRNILRMLDDMKIPGVDGRKRIDQQGFSKVKMTKGVDPAQAFGLIKQAQRR